MQCWVTVREGITNLKACARKRKWLVSSVKLTPGMCLSWDSQCFGRGSKRTSTANVTTSTKVLGREKKNFVAWARERTIPIERQPLVGEVGANFRGYMVPRGQHEGPPSPYSRISRPEPLLSLCSSSSILATRLSGPRSRPTTSQKIW
jgi:hypothetical protein